MVSVTQTSPEVIWSPANESQAKISLSGRINVYTLGLIWTKIRLDQDAWLKQGQTAKGSLVLEVDAGNVEYLDGAGIAFLIDIKESQEKGGGKFVLQNLDSRYQPLIEQFDPIGKLFPVIAPKSPENFVIRLGREVDSIMGDAADLVVFIGHLFSDLFWSLTHPRQVRWGDFVNTAVEAGIAALPIVGLVSFLIGVILSFQSAVGMQKFGAVTFVGPLVALGIFRELGPLITAILLAGRSSAAFAAEIGTMTVNSEVDALVTGGLSPIRFLVVPRVLAGILVAPILTLFADIVSICASAFTMLAYGVPMINFYNGLLQIVDLEDILSGLLKALLFGVVVSSVGCLRGMQTTTGAAAVGISATRAVVSSIVMIVLVDGIFAYISYRTGF